MSYLKMLPLKDRVRRACYAQKAALDARMLAISTKPSYSVTEIQLRLSGLGYAIACIKEIEEVLDEKVE